MKHRILLATAALAIAAAFTGCGTVRTLVRPAQTNIVTKYYTNEVTVINRQPVITTELNPIPGESEIRTTNIVNVTNVVFDVRPTQVPVVTPPVYYDARTIDPAALAGAQVLGSAAPFPWAAAATGLATTIGTALVGFLNSRAKSKALAEADADNEHLATAAETLVGNFETLRKTALTVPQYQALDERVMREVKQAQAAAGVKATIADVVEDHTEFTKPIV